MYFNKKVKDSKFGIYIIIKNTIKLKTIVLIKKYYE